MLELQSSKGEKGWQYRVVRYWKDNIGAKVCKSLLLLHFILYFMFHIIYQIFHLTTYYFLLLILDPHKALNCPTKPDLPVSESSLFSPTNQTEVGLKSDLSWRITLGKHKNRCVFVLTEGSGEGYAGVSVHLGRSSGGLQGPERDPAGYRSADEEQHPSPGPGPGFRCTTAGTTHSLHLNRSHI